MELTIYKVDAFSQQLFSGNPAAVCLLEEWLPELVMQAIAGEINLSETTFIVAKGEDYRIRWFTPTKEVNLCGHATLATAHVLHTHYGLPLGQIKYHSKSGILTTTSDGDRITLNFPVNRPQPVEPPPNLSAILGGSPKATYAWEDLVVFYDDATEVEILEPDLAAITKLPYRGVCVTAPSPLDDTDFVCRFFAPAYGINEDPVTGSAYTAITPLYSDLMGKQTFSAKQLSKRGGYLELHLDDNRINISGRAITVMKSTFYLNATQE